mmetsp:Transcript_7721/g.18787  ORF Transcript_7721/g.18787 Transcript_7721/m.18787 type:complete len:515 (+) Transcript_7721:1989-3533(+)
MASEQARGKSGLEAIERLANETNASADVAELRQLHRLRRGEGALANKSSSLELPSLLSRGSKKVAPAATPSASLRHRKPPPKPLSPTLDRDASQKPLPALVSALRPGASGGAAADSGTGLSQAPPPLRLTHSDDTCPKESPLSALELSPALAPSLFPPTQRGEMSPAPMSSVFQLSERDEVASMSALFLETERVAADLEAGIPSEASTGKPPIDTVITGWDKEAGGESLGRVRIFDRIFDRDSLVQNSGRDPESEGNVPREIEMGPKYFQFSSFWGTVDVTRPVKSLDQIYLQASILSPLFRAYILKIAAQCDGMLKFKRPATQEDVWDGPQNRLQEGANAKWKTTFESWQNVRVEQEPQTSGSSSSYGISTETRVSDGKGGGVVWAPLKSLKRATEKALRVYKGDLSRLVDVCRETLVFATTESMAACLLTILEDRSMVVLRIKNLMNPSYDAEKTAGFRCVIVNLRIVSDSTTYFGVDTHVCELQLVLLPIILLRGDHGHKKYISFRDVRGE